jgi:hypothetical protein
MAGTDSEVVVKLGALIPVRVLKAGRVLVMAVVAALCYSHDLN